MTTYDYTQKMLELRARVTKYGRLPVKNNKNIFVDIREIVPKINTQSLFYYIIPVVLLIVILVSVKPKFICNEHIDDENIITNKLSYKKLFTTIVVFCIIISIGIFVYNSNVKNRA
jgi:hypothetical protein